ncbi:hypothetical protein [Streptomyces sp. AM 2-1-1]|uniref:hypothetical protein n=1 Tax=Streptomyces sp. AM 2-1-1 TaxID=3028709 RepID=UPI0023B9F8C7|nr:hypothetical protein [Streptomyces sp. AM 2-1-1]WEH40779.1 hypothetical protein PZB77_15415 [Streptomyces sp. AM 2-1-1]
MNRATVGWTIRTTTRQGAAAYLRISRRSAHQLAAGSSLLAHRITDRATAWVRAGRRDDLTGLPAVLGCALRLVLLAAGTYGLWRLVRQWPALLWLIVPVWCWRALRATPDDAVPETAPEAPGPDPRDAVLRLLYEALGDRPSMYLSDLLQHLQKEGHGKGWTVATLRARLEALGIPVEMRLKTGGRGASRGVVRAQLPPLSQPDPAGLSPAPSTAA